MRIRYQAITAAMAGLISIAAAPPPTVEQLLRANRHGMTLQAGHLTGEGGAIVERAVRDARVVALGEDHFTREVPAFGQALCTLMAPDLAAVVVEAGPIATGEIAPLLKRPDRLEKTSAWMRRYPNGVAFLDSRADNDFIDHCARVSADQHFRLIGVDQEYVGSAGLIIDRMLATRMSPQARKAVLALREEERQGAATARESGDPSKLLILAITETRIAEIEAALSRGSSPEARRLFAALVDSHRIYQKNAEGAWDSNLVRSRLMKKQFVAAVPPRGKLLLKFGDFHLYKGVGPRGLRDLGNYVAEMADGEGRPSLHILLLGATGVHATFGGYARPTGREPFSMVEDSDYRWLKPVVGALLPGQWTVIDLRPFRQTRIADLDSDWRRTINGYDLMIVAPEFTPSESL